MFVQLNKNQGTVTMPYAAYKELHHDSLMLHILLRAAIVPEEERNKRLEEYIGYERLGEGFAHAQSPLADNDAFEYVYGQSPQMCVDGLREDRDIC